MSSRSLQKVVVAGTAVTGVLTAFSVLTQVQAGAVAAAIAAIVAIWEPSGDKNGRI